MIPPPSAAPVITSVGVVTDLRIGQTIRYTFTDGTVTELQPGAYRQLTPHGWGGFGLVIIGTDADGPFVAAFPRQEGLPDDCFVENDVGIERGAFIEIHGVLWAKAPGFSTPLQPAMDTPYPGGTRFCFNDEGLVASVIAP